MSSTVKEELTKTDGKSDTLKTNEQIIEELTKGLESSCINSKGRDATVNDDVTDGKVVGTNVSSNDPLEVNSVDDSETLEKDNSNEDHSNNFVDEEALKDREMTLSESDKESLRNEAEKLKNEGNELFKKGDYLKAIVVYTQGLQTCPLAYSKERSILYANRAAARVKCLDKESGISDCSKAVELNPEYVKAYVRRAQLYEETEKLDEALEDYKKILTFDPSHVEANYAIRRLPPLIDERNERLKTEMLGKLKDLGNMVLKPFGLSTNNFQLEKDPSSGGYSVKFQQNPS